MVKVMHRYMASLTVLVHRTIARSYSNKRLKKMVTFSREDEKKKKKELKTCESFKVCKKDHPAQLL